jgi:hypothetical protein
MNNSAARVRFGLLTAAMWLALPFTAFRYWQTWDRLPARMVTHFGAHGQPNGWMTPQQSLTFSLIFLSILLAVFTVILAYALQRTQGPETTTWALLGLFGLMIGIFTFVSDSVLRYNLSQASVPVAPVVFITILGIAIFVIVFLRAQRGSTLPASALISEETHASRRIALVFLLPAAAMVVSAVVVPIPGVKASLAAAALVMFGCSAMAWDGFHYLFTAAGLDICTLGFRLRSIPAAEIQSYFVDRWNALGGYGIRGLGNRRAYVWGNRGVRIKTSLGEVFLGHSEPQKIARDLDFVTNHQAHEGKK